MYLIEIYTKFSYLLSLKQDLQQERAQVIPHLQCLPIDKCNEFKVCIINLLDNICD